MRSRRRNTQKGKEFAVTDGPGDLLARNLKLVFDEVAAEPIPDNWLQLVDLIDAKSRRVSKGKAPDKGGSE